MWYFHPHEFVLLKTENVGYSDYWCIHCDTPVTHDPDYWMYWGEAENGEEWQSLLLLHAMFAWYKLIMITSCIKAHCWGHKARASCIKWQRDLIFCQQKHTIPSLLIIRLQRAKQMKLSWAKAARGKRMTTGKKSQELDKSWPNDSTE